MYKKLCIFATVIFSLLPPAAHAQYPFGKNKVIYSKKDWKVLETEHVDIYHYPSERNVVLLCAPTVEETFKEYSELFGIEFRHRLPLVFYSSHYDFEQTNILPTLIPDYTAGFTDLIKGRIAIPFTGSINELRHVIRHEMVHAFMLEKMDQVLSAHNKFNSFQPPLWFTEGLAEYIASGEADTRSRMFVRDALISGRLPDLNNIWRIEGSFMMYKEGEAVVRYIADNFGREALIKILENWWKADRFHLILKETIGMDLQELNDSFMKSIKRRYLPAVLHRSFAPELGVQLTKPGTFHSQPVARVDANGHLETYALCARHGTISICRIVRNNDGKFKEKVIIEGGRSSRFESIPALRSKMDIRGDTLVFVSKSRSRDAVYLWDLKRNREINSFNFQNLSMISSPSLSPEGKRLVFAAIDTSGMADLYLYHMVSGELERLTHDPFSEEDPDFSPTNDEILFASDRCSDLNNANTGIYWMEIKTKRIKPITCGKYSDSNPEWLPDGKSFLYTSDMNGTFDVYLYHGGEILRQTNVIGGVTSPAYIGDGSGFVSEVYYQGEFHIFFFPLKTNVEGARISIARVDPSLLHWNPPRNAEMKFKTKDYKMKLGIDLIGTGIAVDPDFGELGNGAQIVFSDLLGNHRFFAFFGNTSEGFEDFWKRINAGITYVNLSHRLNYMLGAFHLTTYWGDFYSPFRLERRYGGMAGISYPFSKFSRVEGSLVIRGIERESGLAGIEWGNAKSVLATTFASYIADNTLWTVGGPLKGMRYYLTLGHTFDFLDRGFESTTLHIDIRKYIRITDRILLAGRFINRAGFGGDAQVFYLGGPWDLRGYDFRQFVGKRIYLFNTELRFPLIDRFALSFPFGTLETPSIRGSLYFDAGKASGFIASTGWLGAIGAGVELNLGYAPVIRVNFTRKTDFDKISNRIKVGFFLGYNY